MSEKYKVYEIIPNVRCYGGVSLVAAKTVDEANCYIKTFEKEDKHNQNNSGGYSNVTEDDVLEHIWSDKAGILNYGIYYRG